MNYRRDIRAVSPYLSTETYTGMKLLPFQSLVRHGGFPALPILVSPDVDLAYLRFSQGSAQPPHLSINHVLHDRGHQYIMSSHLRVHLTHSVRTRASNLNSSTDLVRLFCPLC